MFRAMVFVCICVYTENISIFVLQSSNKKALDNLYKEDFVVTFWLVLCPLPWWRLGGVEVLRVASSNRIGATIFADFASLSKVISPGKGVFLSDLNQSATRHSLRCPGLGLHKNKCLMKWLTCHSLVCLLIRTLMHMLLSFA